MVLYMAVTADKYELPLCVCESPLELARKFGISKGTLFSSISQNRSGLDKGRKFVRVKI